MQSNSSLSLVFLLLLLVFSHPSSTQAQETEDEREFDYVRGGPIGPEKWGEIQKEWSLCSYGTMQSPIDMSSQRVKKVENSYKFNRNYKPCNATLTNRGHDISLQWEGDAGSVVIDDTEYALKQAHWHSPSEHTINGIIPNSQTHEHMNGYDMEIHLVHLSIDNKIAVISVFYNISRPNEFLSMLEANITSMINQKGKRVHAGIIDPRDIRMSRWRYYRYIGSLTVPPCTEEVVWMISRKITTVSKDQVTLLREAVHDYAKNNARPLQPDNKRDIVFYGPASR